MTLESHLYIFLDIQIEKIGFMLFADINSTIWNDDDPEVTLANTLYYNNGLITMKKMMMMMLMMMMTMMMMMMMTMMMRYNVLI